MRILRLRAENIKRLKAIDITPESDVVVISGRNGQGKTSAIDSISYALSGAKNLPSMPLRRGAKKGKISIDLDGMKVERTFTDEGNSYLTVTDKTGVVKSPQGILDKLYGTFTFDPLKFSRMERDERVVVLKKLAGIDFTEIDQKRQKSYDDRTVINRDVKSLESQLSALPVVIAPDEEESIADLTKQYQDKANEIKANESSRLALQNKKDEYSDLKEKSVKAQESIKDLEAKLVELKSSLEKIEADKLKCQQEGKSMAAEVAKLIDPDLTVITEKMQTVEETNRKVRQKNERHALEEKLKEKRSESEVLSYEIEGLDSQKKEQLEAAKMPIPGLSFDAGDVTFNEIPFEQISAAEQLKVSLAMGMALNPELRVMLIRDGSLLDAASFETVKEMAASNDYQIWTEVVSDGEAVGIVIEDGMVKE